MLVLVDDGILGVLADITGGHDAIAVHADGDELGLLEVGVGKFDLLEVEDDVSDIFHHAGEAAEFVLGSFDFDGGDGGTFEGGKQDAAEAVADGVAVTAFKRLSNEFAVGVGGGGFVFGETIRHFEAGESD